MNAIPIYLIHLAAFGGGVAVLEVLRRKDVAWKFRAAAGVLMCVAMAVFGFRVSEPPDIFSDYFKAYHPAAVALVGEGGMEGLADTMRQGAGGFVNLPVLAWLFAPFALLPQAAGANVFFLLGVAATIAAWWSLSRLAGLDGDRSLLLLLVFSACGPLHNSLREGNTTHFILLLLVCGLWALRGRRDLLAGLVFGFAALVKLPLLLLGVYFVARGRWRVGAGGAAVCGLAAATSLLMFGWDLHVFWYEHSIKPFAETPLSAFNVQSVQGFFARFQHGADHLLDWTPHELDPAVKIGAKLAALAMLGTVALVIGGACLRRRNRVEVCSEDSAIELETCAVVLLAMMISTVSWSHYYLWVLLPAAFLIGGNPKMMASPGIRVAGWIGLIGALPPVVIFIASHPLVRKAHACLAVSHYFLSAVLLLAVLLVAIWRCAGTEPKPSRK